MIEAVSFRRHRLFLFGRIREDSLARESFLKQMVYYYNSMFAENRIFVKA